MPYSKRTIFACPPSKLSSAPEKQDLLDPLDQATAGKESRENIAWSDELLLTFKTAQHALENHRTFTIPQPQDALWIVTYGTVKNRGIAAILYVHRSGQLLLAGFFSDKLRRLQVTWLPCEIQALGIGAAIKHFVPILFNHHTQPRYSPTADLASKLTKSSREESSQPVPESPPSYQQSAAILSSYVISQVLRTYPLITQAETQKNAWIRVAKSANSLLNSKILLSAASPCFGNFNFGIPVDVIWVKCVNSFLDPSGVPVSVSINKLYLVPKRVMAGLVGVLRNGGGLGTGESYIPVVFFDSLMHRSSCFPDIDFSAFTRNPVYHAILFSRVDGVFRSHQM